MPKPIPAAGEAMPAIDRRTLLQGLVATALIPATADAAPHNHISAMCEEWLAIRYRDFRSLTGEENDTQSERYIDLQNRILASKPQSPRDVAIMFLVDTDDGDSYHSEAFENRMRGLTGIEAKAVQQ